MRVELFQRALRIAAGRADPRLERFGVECLAARDALPGLVDDLCVVGHSGRVTAAGALSVADYTDAESAGRVELRVDEQAV